VNATTDSCLSVQLSHCATVAQLHRQFVQQSYSVNGLLEAVRDVQASRPDCSRGQHFGLGLGKLTWTSWPPCQPRSTDLGLAILTWPPVQTKRLLLVVSISWLYSCIVATVSLQLH